MFHDGSIWLTLGCGPSGPADEAVDCVAVLRLVQWELVTPPVELVAAILQPVWPRDQRLTPARGAHLVGPISIKDLPTAGGVRAESPADLEDHSALIPAYDFDCSPDGAITARPR